MGGIGSGRKCLNRTTSQWFRLDVRWLQKHDMLQEGVKRRFRMTREKEQVSVLLLPHARSISLHLDFGQDLFGPRTMDTVVRLRWEPCPYGGVQPLLGCQGRGCERYVHILYGRESFLCRWCRHVTYPIQRVHPRMRALARVQLLRLRLGGDPDEVNGPFPARPKGMHAWTYTKKIGQILIAERAASIRLLEDFGKSEKRDPAKEEKELFDELEELARDLEIPGHQDPASRQNSAGCRPGPQKAVRS